DLPARMGLRHLDEPSPDDIEAIAGGCPLSDDPFAGLALPQLRTLDQSIDECLELWTLPQWGEILIGPNQVLHGPLAIIGLEILTEGRASLHDIEDVAEHLEHNGAIIRGDGRRRSRVMVHAAHLAEEVPWLKRCERAAVGQRDGGVDRDGLA